MSLRFAYVRFQELKACYERQKNKNDDDNDGEGFVFYN